MMMKEQIKITSFPLLASLFSFPNHRYSREQSDEIATNRTRFLLNE